MMPPQCSLCERARQGLVPEKKVFEVHIEQGHKHGAKVVLRGEAGCSDPNVQPGDVVFVLEQRPHKLFKRVSNDLVMDKVRAGAGGLLRLSGPLSCMPQAASVWLCAALQGRKLSCHVTKPISLCAAVGSCSGVGKVFISTPEAMQLASMCCTLLSRCPHQCHAQYSAGPAEA